MKVLFDTSGTAFYAGGITVYIQQLARLSDLFADYGVELAISDLPRSIYPPLSSIIRRKLSVFMWEFYYMQCLMPLRVRSSSVQLIHAPGIRFPIMASRPVVVTIHDVIPIFLPQVFSMRGGATIKMYLLLAKRFAKMFVAVSETTRNDIQKYLGVSSERIAVTHLGVRSNFVPQSNAKIQSVREKLDISYPYILCVGNIEPRKNLVRLLEAFAIARKRGILHHLVIVGKAGKLSQAIYQKVLELGLTSVTHFTGFIDDSDLAALYSGADLFVYPSIYEGFGLPVIEAMACGCPVITSNVSSLPEVAGDAALYIDPQNTNDIAQGIERVLNDRQLADRLRLRGHARSALFTWERCAEATAQAYRRALML